MFSDYYEEKDDSEVNLGHRSVSLVSEMQIRKDVIARADMYFIRFWFPQRRC